MKQEGDKVSVSTPGRICLFGEHQDYIQLPVIAAAISRRIRIEGIARRDRTINIELPDIGDRETFQIADHIPYTKERDYYRSVVNVLLKRNIHFPHGYDCQIHGTIPINAGTASSSALVVCWAHFLLQMSEPPRTPTTEELAEIAYQSEVLEFSEPGGMMDHYSTANGGIIWLESFPRVRMNTFKTKLGSFVLGDSHQPKDTKYVLANVKNKLLEIVDILSAKNPKFSLQSITVEELEGYRGALTERQMKLLEGTIRNRNLSFEAKSVLERYPLDDRAIGDLLNKQQDILREVLHISTSTIDRMIDKALNAGAFGAKINGSGGGGCMFAYAPENAEAVAEVVQSVSEAGVVTVDEGSKVERS